MVTGKQYYTMGIGQPNAQRNEPGAPGVVSAQRRTMSRCITGRSNAVLASSTIWTGSGLVTGLTQHQRHALATHFDAVRIGIPNMHTSTVAGVKVVFGASNALGSYTSTPTANSSTGTSSAVPVPTETVSSTLSTWREALFGGATSATLPVAVSASNIWPSWTWTDWCQVASVDRTDGGTYPILDLRIFIPVAAGSITTAFTGASNQAWGLWGRTDLFTNGRVCRIWNQDVDGVTTPGDFTSTTTTPVMIPVIVQYISRTTGATLMTCGDSILEGSTGPTYIGDSFAWRAALDSTFPVEVCAQGFGGATSIQATNRARTVVAEVNPSHILAPSASTNNFGTTLGIRVTGESTGSLGVLASLAEASDAQLGVYGFLPVTNAAKGYGATDSFRTSANATVASRAETLGATYIDLVGTVSGATVSSQIEPAASMIAADGIHYNDTGNDAMAQPVLNWLNP